MHKEFLNVTTIRDNALRLAEKMHNDGFIPSVIYVGLRGGSTLGNVISEYFKLIAPIDAPPLYAAVVSHSYQGLESSQQVHIDGWTYEPKFLRHSDNVLLVDDIFDSGLTINVIANIILAHNISRDRLKIAVHDYKERLFRPHNQVHVPHYYSRKFEIKTLEEDNWIHYMSHELDGLTDQELQDQYDLEIQPTIRRLLAIRKKNFAVSKTQNN